MSRLRTLIADIGDLFEQSELEETVDTGDALELLRRALEALTEAQAALNAMATTDDSRSCLYCDKDKWEVEHHKEGCPYRFLYRALGDLDECDGA